MANITPSDIIQMSQKYGRAVTKEILEKEGFKSKGDEEMKTLVKPIAKEELTAALNNTLRGQAIPPQFQNALTTTGDGAVLIPEELKTDVEVAKKYNKSMRQYVDVITVKTGKGYFATEDEGNFGEMVQFGDNVPITEQDMKFKGVNWNLQKYGSFSKVSEELYNDIEFDLMNFFANTHAEKATKTENKLIFNAIRNTLTVKSLADVPALKSSLNKDLNPALENEILIVTNQDGFDLFNQLDADGNPLKYFETDGPKRHFDIYRFEVYSNDELPSINGNAPFIYGSFKCAVKLFTSNQLRVLVNKKSGLLTSTHFLRGVEDYDVQLMPEATQLLLGEIPLV